jgi:transposase, IS30 family
MLAEDSIVIFTKKSYGGLMPEGYHHLTKYTRCQLYALMKRGDSALTMAKELNIHRSTVYRELKRNSGLRGYRYKQAHEKASHRRSHASSKKPKMSEDTTSVIEEKLRLQWSPEQIAGWLKKQEHPRAVSHETIYKYVWSNKRKGGALYKELRHSGKKYNKRSKGKAGRGCIPNRVDINERPKEVEDKIRLGDWELDTIIGTAQSGAIVSMVERRSKLTKLGIISKKTAAAVEKTLLESLGPIKDFVLTLTSDNGKEFANHEGVRKALDAGFYFAKPYHSWERGLNEHTNGLIRQYFPKSRCFNGISAAELMKIEILLNNRPRKVLEFSTPIEIFNQLSGGGLNVALQS